LLNPGGKGGIIVLITDGMETIRPNINEVYPELIDSQARVVSVAFGQVQQIFP
jgi:hypothetical protein